MKNPQEDYNDQQSSASSKEAELSVSGPALRIGYDGKRALKNATGLGNYSRWLISTLACSYENLVCFVYSPEIRQSPEITILQNTPRITLRLPAGTKFLWRSFGIIKDLLRDKIALYHGLSHEIPFSISKTRIKTVVTIHDLIFLRHPEWYRPIDRIIYRMKCSYACRHADRIIAISEKTKEDIIHFFGIPAAKIEVVYQSCNPVYKSEPAQEAISALRAKFSLPSRYLLNVGTIEPRKNLIAAVEALALVGQDLHLVVVGRKTGYYKKVLKRIRELNLQSNILFLENVSLAELPVLYRHAEAFIYPSRYEGFGIPILEALQSGTPVIGATGSCLEEAGGPDSKYVDPDDFQALAKHISEIVNNPALKHEMAKRGRIFAQRFDDQLLAEQLMDVYQKTLKHA